jgi:hypothetical protein
MRRLASAVQRLTSCRPGSPSSGRRRAAQPWGRHGRHGVSQRPGNAALDRDAPPGECAIQGDGDDDGATRLDPGMRLPEPDGRAQAMSSALGLHNLEELVASHGLQMRMGARHSMRSRRRSHPIRAGLATETTAVEITLRETGQPSCSLQPIGPSRPSGFPHRWSRHLGFHPSHPRSGALQTLSGTPVSGFVGSCSGVRIVEHSVRLAERRGHSESPGRWRCLATVRGLLVRLVIDGSLTGTDEDSTSREAPTALGCGMDRGGSG